VLIKFRTAAAKKPTAMMMQIKLRNGSSFFISEFKCS
jgi:hypothetical protein